jgi:TolA-binding protein
VINIATIDYSKLKTEYLRGNISYRELAKKHDVSFSTLRKVAAKEHWTELRNKARTKADTKIIDAISDKKAKKAIDVVDVADKLLGKISEMLDMDVNAYNTQNIKNLTSALKDLKDIKGIKSEADKLEQMARIAKLQKEAEADDNNNTEITVTFGTEGARNKWAE